MITCRAPRALKLNALSPSSRSSAAKRCNSDSLLIGHPPRGNEYQPTARAPLFQMFLNGIRSVMNTGNALEAVDEPYRQQTDVPLAGLVLVADLVELFPFDAHAHVAGEIVADARA